jgi:hypothetical protein
MAHPCRGTILGAGKPAREDKEIQMRNPVAWFEIVGSDGDMGYGLVAAEAPGIAGASATAKTAARAPDR